MLTNSIDTCISDRTTDAAKNCGVAWGGLCSVSSRCAMIPNGADTCISDRTTDTATNHWFTWNNTVERKPMAMTTALGWLVCLTNQLAVGGLVGLADQPTEWDWCLAVICVWSHPLESLHLHILPQVDMRRGKVAVGTSLPRSSELK